MSERVVYHVEAKAGPRVSWVIKREGVGIVSEYDKKETAIAEARRLAMTHPESQVKLHEGDGTFEEVRTDVNNPHRQFG